MKSYKKSNIRWCMLVMACFFMLGNNFSYDSPGPLETQLRKQFNMDSYHYSLLYTVYSLPNMFLPILGGILLDSIGIRSGLILFATILAIGQGVFMLGGFQADYTTMIVGRVIFGMGGESMSVAQSSIISVWFKGKELAFALGLNLSVARLGSVINGDVVPAVYDSNGLGMALGVGFVLCIFSLVNGIGMAYVDRRAEEIDKERLGEVETAAVNEDDKFKWSDLTEFGVQFWLLTGSCVLTYMSVFPYIQNASNLLQTKYGFDNKTAGALFGVPYIISAIASPFLGLMIDKVGKRAFLCCLSSCVLIVAYTTSLFMPKCDKCYNEMVPLVLTGIGYSIYASAIWGSVPYVVPKKSVGSAFGLATAIQNIGLVIAPTLVGHIKDSTAAIGFGYTYVNILFIAINVVGLILNSLLYYIDITYNDGVLDKVDNGDEAPAAAESNDDNEQFAKL